MVTLTTIIATLWAGVLASIAPCPLTTNILAISFLGRQGGGRGAVLLRSLAYACGGMVVYAMLGAAVVWGTLSSPDTTAFLQRFMPKVLGIVLILVGMVLTGLLRPRFRLTLGAPSRHHHRGIAGAAMLGIMLAISFCPTTAALFFGMMLPTAVASRSAILLPSLYGLGAALPVAVLGALLAAGVQVAGGVSQRLQAAEKWLRMASGAAFIAVGMWMCLRNTFGLF